MSEQQQLYKNLLLGEYKIVLKMKEGAFGTVYLAKNKAGKEFAIKISKGKNSDEISTEKQIYTKLSEAGCPKGFVKYYQSGDVNGRNFIVMELLGSDLDDLCTRGTLKRFSLKSSLMIGRHVLDRLQSLHGLGYIHRDIKPDNLAVGIRDLSRTVYLLDFGLAKKLNPLDKEPKKCGGVGTYRFMSVNSHNGLELSRRDDIESFCYLIMIFIEGKLPWQGNRIDTKQGLQNIKKYKANLTAKDFTRPIPQEIFKMLTYARQLPFNAAPNYEYLKELLSQAMQKNKIHYDNRFDWVKEGDTPEKHPRKQSQSKSPPKIKDQKFKEDKIKEEKPRKNAVVNEIDKQIVAVFKFCNQGDLVSTKKKQPQIKAQKQMGHNPPPSRQNKFRPQSAQKAPNFDPRLYTRNHPVMDFQGPRIIINKQAKYKI